ncbi:MAG TPA: hypothetical protein VK876_00580, partial [Rubrivivax sp.]|nr:hypothetical protein [Rubrivivax sp.]
MTDPAATPWRIRLAAWHDAGSAGLRAALVGLAAFALAYVGSFSLPFSPWNTLALPGGLAVAAVWRWGRPVLTGVAASVFVALLGLGLPWTVAVLAPLVLVLATLSAQAALQWAGFDARLERATDVAALAAAVWLAAALPAALAVSVWVTARSGGPPLATFVAGWVTLGLGMLCTAVAALAFDRSVLHALQPGAPWRGSVAGAALASLTLGLVVVAPAAGSALALFLPPVVVTALVLRRHLAMAASTLLLAVLLVARSVSEGLAPWATGVHGP